MIVNDDRRRRLFINRDRDVIGIVAIGKRRRSCVFNEWESIEKIYIPSEESRAEGERKLILKYKKLAKIASFSNAFLRDIAKADLTKSLYENPITTDNAIDGKCIRLATIEKYCGSHAVRMFREAIRKHERFSPLRLLRLRRHYMG